MTKVFISYKTGVPNDQEAELMYNELIKEKYDVFLDKRRFHAGITWDQSIYGNISSSDVLIVLITADAAYPWVQREVDYALGCRVEILPVVIQAADQATADDVQKKLAIADKQYAKAFGSNKPEIRYGEVLEAIPILAKATRVEQQIWMSELQKKWKTIDDANEILQPYAPTTLKYASYAFFANPRNAHACTIHVTAGNITQISGVDVLVNSENVYLQMQRVFAKESVSKRIRLDGAKTRGPHSIDEDTIQQELNHKLMEPNGVGVPVEQCTVVVTSAGNSNSKLRRRGIHFVFHVAVVNATLDTEFLVDNPDIVKLCVENCFKAITDMSAAQSSFSQQRDDILYSFKAIDEINAAQSPVESIIFPLLASGNAGLNLTKSANAILESCKEFLTANPQTALKNIYITAFTRGDVDELVKLFDSDSALTRV